MNFVSYTSVSMAALADVVVVRVVGVGGFAS